MEIYLHFRNYVFSSNLSSHSSPLAILCKYNKNLPVNWIPYSLRPTVCKKN